MYYMYLLTYNQNDRFAFFFRLKSKLPSKCCVFKSVSIVKSMHTQVVLTGHACFYRFSEKLYALYQFHLHFRISKRYQKTAKQNSFNFDEYTYP